MSGAVVRPYGHRVAEMTRAQATRHDAAALAEEAYVFAYPLVLMDHAMNLRTSNRLVHDGRMADTLRISAWLDLDAEPIVLSAPDTRGRYYVLCLRDAWSTMFASAGARTTGTEERVFAVLGPGRHGAHLPVGVTPIAAPTRIAHLAGSLEALGDKADPDLERITAGLRLAPLSRCHEVDDDASVPPPGPPAADPAEQVEALEARRFFGEALRLVAGNPPEPSDRPALEQLREIAPLEAAAAWQHLGPEWRAALTEGVRRGRATVRAIAGHPPTEREGHWRVSYDGGR